MLLLACIGALVGYYLYGIAWWWGAMIGVAVSIPVFLSMGTKWEERLILPWSIVVTLAILPGLVRLIVQ